ncbi:MAG: hypothetical protein LUC50_02110, partial [Ruminococcus sp.]|nr:hypothetical protein [Ruminococcus sp.]
WVYLYYTTLSNFWGAVHFFQAGKMEDFKRAFGEFASDKQNELISSRAEINRQQIRDMVKQVSHEPKKKEKVHEKSKDMTH